MDSTKPPIPFYIPSSGELNGAIYSGVGVLFGSMDYAKIKEHILGYTDKGNTIRFYPSCYEEDVKRFKHAGTAGKTVNWATFGFDIGNTWSDNNGNTIKKRLEKTGVQGGRFALSFGIGYVEGPGMKACVESADKTFFISLLGLGVIGGIDYEINKFLDNEQNKIYKKLEIR